MKTLSLSCNQCGASLTPPEDARFVTCSYCQARLQVHHEGNTYFTRAMEALAESTAQIADDLEVIKIQNELARVDREWRLEREKYLVRTKDGGREEPGSGGWVGMIVALIMCGVMASFFAGAPGGMEGMALVPVGMGVLVVVVSFLGMQKAEDFRAAKAQYERERIKLVQELLRAKEKAKD